MRMGGKFEEEPGGLLSFSEAPLRIGVCKCTWIALSSVTYGGLLFWVIFLLFQIIQLFSLSLEISSGGPNGEWGMLQHSLLLGSELGLLAMVAFMTFLVPTLIMTWITALVFQYLFGRRLFGRRRGLVEEGAQMAKDIAWMTIKSMLRKVNVAATFVLVFALLARGFTAKMQDAEM